MFTPLTQAEIVNGVVFAVVLHGDLGGHRKIGPLRILRPLLTAGVLVPLFVSSPATRGTGLAVELAGAAAGVVGGLAALALFRVYRSPRTGRPVSSAGWPYALLWFLVVAARALFSYGCFHWFPRQLADWGAAHRVTGDALADGLIFMAVAMVVIRSVGLAVRASRLPAAAPAADGPSPLSAGGPAAADRG